MASGRGTVGNLLVNMRVELGQLRTDVKEIEKTFSSGFANIKSSATSFGRDLASSLGIGLSVGAVIGFAKQILALADNLKNLSEQTGISAQTLSGIKSTLEESGSSLEGFATGIFRLQKELGAIKNEGDPAAQAIKQLGLDFNKLREASPEDFLDAIVEAFGKIENPLNRAALMFQLLGRNSRDLGPALQALVGHLDELRQRGLTEEQVKILDDFGDSLTAMKNASLLAAASFVSNLTPALAKLYEWLLKAEIGLLRTKRALTLFGSPENFDKMLAEVRSQLAKVEDFNANVGQPSSHQEVPPKFKPPVDDAALKKAADEAKRLAGELKKLAETIGESNSKLEEQLIDLRHGAAAAEDYALAQQEMREAAKGMTADILHEQERRRALTEQLREEKLARDDLHRLAEQSRKDTPFVEESTRFGLNAEELKEFAENENRVNEQTRQLREEWAKFQDQASLGLITDDGLRRITELGIEFNKLATRLQEMGDALGLSQEAIDNVITGVGLTFKNQMDKIKPAETEAEKMGEQLGNALSQGLKNTLLGIETGQTTLAEGMKNLFRNMVLEVQGMILDKAFVQPLAQAFSSWITEAMNLAAQGASGGGGGGWLGSLFGFFGSMFGGLFGGGMGSAGGTWGNMPFAPGAIPIEERGGPILGFASGGMVPIMAHQGEFVMNRRAVDAIGAANMSRMNQTGEMPRSNISLDFQGAQIIPRAPWTTPDDVIKVTIRHISDDGALLSVFKDRMRTS